MVSNISRYRNRFHFSSKDMLPVVVRIAIVLGTWLRLLLGYNDDRGVMLDRESKLFDLKEVLLT
jgi:hypothetical protein